VAPEGATFSFTLDRTKLRQVRRREGRYLLRTNLTGKNPAELWQFYIQLVEVEAAFKTMKDDLQLRPIYHQLEHRIEAHIFVAFLAYCMHVTLRAWLKPLAPSLTARASSRPGSRTGRASSYQTPSRKMKPATTRTEFVARTSSVPPEGSAHPQGLTGLTVTRRV
jgi:hypothetical protein